MGPGHIHAADLTRGLVPRRRGCPVPRCQGRRTGAPRTDFACGQGWVWPAAVPSVARTSAGRNTRAYVCRPSRRLAFVIMSRRQPPAPLQQTARLPGSRPKVRLERGVLTTEGGEGSPRGAPLSRLASLALFPRPVASRLGAWVSWKRFAAARSARSRDAGRAAAEVVAR